MASGCDAVIVVAAAAGAGISLVKPDEGQKGPPDSDFWKLCERTTTTTMSSSSPTRTPRTTSSMSSSSSRNTTASLASAASASLLGEGEERLSDEQNRQLLLYAAYAVGIAVAVKVVVSAIFSLYILALPVAFMYALQTCPAEASFDAKKELKRVMRGHHLPEDHPDKPRVSTCYLFGCFLSECNNKGPYAVTRWNSICPHAMNRLMMP